MTMLAVAAIAAVLSFQQQPTSNPDAATQRQPAPASPSTGKTQEHADVPQSQTDTKSPDMQQSKHHHKPKKNKHQKSTESTSTT